MRFTIEQNFAGPLEQVEAAFVDPAFVEHMGSEPLLGRPALLRQEEAGQLVHRWVRYAFTGDVNATVRRVVDPERLTWVEESTLDRDTHETTWRIVPDHYRNLLRCSGTFRLEASSPDLTRRTTEAEMKVTVPLVGGRVESAIVAGLRDHAALEEKVLDGWLQAP